MFFFFIKFELWWSSGRYILLLSFGIYLMYIIIMLLFEFVGYKFINILKVVKGMIIG